MKTYIIACSLGAFLSISSQSVAQDSVLGFDPEFFGNNNIGITAGPTFKVSQLADEAVYELGGILAATVTRENHQFAIGGSAFTMTNDLVWDNNSLLDTTYGGVWLGYTYQPEAVLHFNTSLLLGVGEVALVDRNAPEGPETTGNFLVGELGAQVDLRLLPFADIGIGSSYRFTSDPGIANLTASDLSNPTVFMNLTFNIQ